MVSNRNNFISHDEHLGPQLEAPVEVLPLLRREDVKVLLVVALLVELAAEECVLEEERVRRLVSWGSLELPEFRDKCRGGVGVQGHLSQNKVRHYVRVGNKDFCERGSPIMLLSRVKL